MRKQSTVVLAAVSAFALVAGLTTMPAAAAPGDVATRSADVEPTASLGEDNLPHPLADQREAERTEALAKLIAGEVKSEKRTGSEVIKLGHGKYVEYKKKETKTDPVLTFLTEFGDATYPAAGGTAGPLHNQIAAPNRTNDNTTIWRSDFTPAYYKELLFAKNKESMGVTTT